MKIESMQDNKGNKIDFIETIDRQYAFFLNNQYLGLKKSKYWITQFKKNANNISVELI